MVFSRARLKPKIEIKIGNTPINQKPETEFLGIILDDDLNWKAHLKHISLIISQRIGILRKISKSCSDKTVLRQLYFSLVYKHV